MDSFYRPKGFSRLNRSLKGGNSTPYRKKLIEVALPLEAINAASAREKSIRHGHPSTLHLWWARRPLAACRAVLFASIVDDPSSRPEEFPTEEAQESERQRLFGIIERLVLWENTNNEQVLNEARQEILRATEGHPPPVLDPFCGGGSIPLEAQRLGLKAHASDLNPVAVLITKALIEIPPKFAGMPPVNPEARKKMQTKIEGLDWPGATGLAEDVRYYGRWMRDEAEKRIGHLYPKAKLSDGSEATVIAWLWARTVKCPNPACGAMMPLVKSFSLSTKKIERAWIEPMVDNSSSPSNIRFIVKTGEGMPPDPPKVGRGPKFKCLACGQLAPEGYLKSEGKSGRIESRLMAIVAEGKKSQIYLSPLNEHTGIAYSAVPTWEPKESLANDPRNIWCVNYGLDTFYRLFTPRQLVALNTFSELVSDAHSLVLRDALLAGIALREGDKNYKQSERAYADAVAAYLALAVDRSANYWSSLTPWGGDFIVQTFGRQALPMIWDYAEGNPFSKATGNWMGAIEWILRCLDKSVPAIGIGSAYQFNATSSLTNEIPNILISTDPPYYDNISYADLSDYFYVWLRRSLGNIYPDLFKTLLTPKEEELIAAPHRFAGNREKAKIFFENGLNDAFSNMITLQNPAFPLTIFYAFRQIESENTSNDHNYLNSKDSVSTGWETMLGGLIKSGFLIKGTWPLRTERDQGLKTGSNSLASSIVLVCRPRPEDAPIGTRKEFLTALRRELPEALRQLQKGNIAPVDLAQAAIGPGMAIFSHYSKVLEADGSSMRVRTALQLINQHLDEYLSEQEGEYDPDTRWALSWFEQYGMNEGPFGDAETLSKAKNTSVSGMVDAGILRAGSGKARLLKREEMDASWNPNTDKRLTVWEAAQHLIRVLEVEGESGAADLQQQLGGLAQSTRDLAYRLYSICERHGWSQEALAYNSLVTAWPRLQELAVEKMRKGGQQTFEV